MSVRLAELEDVLARVHDGVSVEVRGAWGSGRSTLLRDVERRLREEGYDVVLLAGEFALREHALEALGVAGVRPLPQPGESEIVARVEMLTRRLTAGPAAVLVDDAAHIDAASWGVVSTVQRVTGASVVYTLDAHAPLGEGALHVLERTVTRLSLAPLRYEEVRALLENQLHGVVDAEMVGRVFAKSGGLPRLVVAIARTGRESGALSQRDGVWHAGADLWQEALALEITEILYPLAAEVREALETLAVAGIVPVERCIALIGSPLLEQLEARDLVSVFPHGTSVMVSVTPSMIAEYYRHQPVSARRVRLTEHVRAVGAGVASPAASPDRPAGRRSHSIAAAITDVRNPALARLVVEHRRARLERRRAAWAQHPNLRSGVSYLDALADAGAGGERGADSRVISALAYDAEWPIESLGLLAHRLERCGGAAAREAGTRYESREDARDTATSESAAVFSAAPAAPAGTRAATFAEARMAVRVERDAAAEAVPQLASVIEALTLASEIRFCGLDPQARAVLDAAVESGPGGDVAGMSRKGADAMPGAELQDELAAIRATALAEALTVSGRFVTALSVLREASASVGGHARSRWNRRRNAVHTLALFCAGFVAEALERSIELRDVAAGELDVDGVRDQSYVAALALVHGGHYIAADEVIGAALGLGEPGKFAHDSYGAILVLGSIVATRRGSESVARSLRDQAETWLPLRSGLPLAAPELATAQILLSQGDDEKALRAVSAVQHEALGAGFSAQASIAEALAREAGGSEGIVMRSVSRTETVEGDLFPPLLDYLRGIDGADGSWLKGAAERLSRTGQTVHATAAALRAAEAYRLSGQTAEASRASTLAHTLGETLDPNVLAYIHGRASLRPELTTREREIAVLAAAGRGNQAIARQLNLSVRTVENHLNKAFRKLGVNRREELDGVGAL